MSSRSVSKEAKRPSESLPYDLEEPEDEAEITMDLMRFSERALSKYARQRTGPILMKGKIVVVPFPFSDLMSSKRRPALVLYEYKDDVFFA